MAHGSDTSTRVTGDEKTSWATYFFYVSIGLMILGWFIFMCVVIYNTEDDGKRKSKKLPPDSTMTLQDISTTLKSLQQDHARLTAKVDTISESVNLLAGAKQAREDDFAEDDTSATEAEPLL